MKKCIFCGKPVKETKYSIQVDDDLRNVYCCNIECYQKTRRYIESYKSIRKTVVYFITAILVVMNLFIIGYHANFRWMYLPLIGLGAMFIADPSIYVTNYFYGQFGILKTLRVFRLIGLAITLFGILLTILWMPGT